MFAGKQQASVQLLTQVMERSSLGKGMDKRVFNRSESPNDTLKVVTGSIWPK